MASAPSLNNPHGGKSDSRKTSAWRQTDDSARRPDAAGFCRKMDLSNGFKMSHCIGMMSEKHSIEIAKYFMSWLEKKFAEQGGLWCHTGFAVSFAV
jgi:hypothetical protein